MAGAFLMAFLTCTHVIHSDHSVTSPIFSRHISRHIFTLDTFDSLPFGFGCCSHSFRFPMSFVRCGGRATLPRSTVAPPRPARCSMCAMHHRTSRRTASTPGVCWESADSNTEPRRAGVSCTCFACSPPLFIGLARRCGHPVLGCSRAHPPAWLGRWQYGHTAAGRNGHAARWQAHTLHTHTHTAPQPHAHNNKQATSAAPPKVDSPRSSPPAIAVPPLPACPRPDHSKWEQRVTASERYHSACPASASRPPLEKRVPSASHKPRPHTPRRQMLPPVRRRSLSDA